MKFKRFGSLVPQRHYPEYNDFKNFHEAPVEKGIYAFPAHYADFEFVFGYGCISNGRFKYVKDKNGKRIMMTQEEFDAIEVKVKDVDHRIVVAPDCLRGLNKESLWLKKTKADAPYDHCDKGEKEDETDDEGDDLLMNEEENTEEDKDKKFPLMIANGRPCIFNYNGNIWHHLETTEAYEHWRRTPDGIKSAKQWILDNKDLFKDCDWEEALNNVEPEPEMKFKRLVKPEDIISRSGSWILTSMRTYEKALEKAMNIAKFNLMLKIKKSREYWGEVEGRHLGLPKSEIDLNNFEVFIEKVKE